MKTNDVLTKQIVRPASLICRVCGDVARGMNFNVMTCMSCKAFFRRNALRPVGTLRCARKFNCDITQEKRSNCAACRLKKCFAYGMKSQLIRSFAGFQLPKLRPVDLLQNDRSTLTCEEWNLLSNIIHAHDEQNLVNSIECFAEERSSLPVKLRAKPSLTLSYLHKRVAWTEPFLRRSSHFHSLSADARRILVTHNIISCATLNGLLTARNLDFLSDSCFLISYAEMFGDGLLKKVLKIHEHLDHNDTLIKIMLFVTAFSSNSSHVTLDSSYDIRILSSSMDLIHIQNIFVTLLWKYLVYQYGWIEAVRRYSSLVKIILDVISMKEEMSNVAVYENMIDTTKKQIEYSLIIED